MVIDADVVDEALEHELENATITVNLGWLRAICSDIIINIAGVIVSSAAVSPHSSIARHRDAIYLKRHS